MRLFSTALPLPPPKENFPSHKRHVLEGPEFIDEEAPDDGEYELLTYRCVHEGIKYENGSNFKINCNYCFCHSGVIACTLIKCWR